MTVLWVLGVWLLVLVSSEPSPTPNLVPAGLPTTQLAALRAIYDATTGKNWEYGRAGAMWSFSSSAATQSDPCLSRWVGVRCDSKNNSVIALDVNYMGLDGKLPEQIGALTALTYLDASVNSLSGTLPAGLFLLTMLRFCQIDSNQLEGTLPADIGLLKALTYLSMNVNYFDGTLSPALGQLKALNELWLSYNFITGSLPIELFDLTALQSLQLSSNQFEGTLSPAVGQLKALTRLDLSSNSLSGLSRTAHLWPGCSNVWPHYRRGSHCQDAEVSIRTGAVPQHAASRGRRGSLCRPPQIPPAVASLCRSTPAHPGALIAVSFGLSL